MRIVFDTNVIVSAALLADSIPRQAFDKALEEGKILISIQSSPSAASSPASLARTLINRFVQLRHDVKAKALRANFRQTTPPSRPSATPSSRRLNFRLDL